MNELLYLKTFWRKKVRRKKGLIVPNVTFNKSSASLTNKKWVFNLTYAFRGALDLKYEKRMKNKKTDMVWTQGPILCFKEGDVITSKDGMRLVQVKFASRMGWDLSKNKMYEGSVIYEVFVITQGIYSKTWKYKCSQMEFLELLIYGKYENSRKIPYVFKMK